MLCPGELERCRDRDTKYLFLTSVTVSSNILRPKDFMTALFNILLSCNYLLCCQMKRSTGPFDLKITAIIFFLTDQNFLTVGVSSSRSFVLQQLAHLNSINRFRNLSRCFLHMDIVFYRTFLASPDTKSHDVLPAY